MKNLFAVLTVLLATAYAYSSTSGYTESIDYDGTLELPHNPYSGKIEPFKFNDEKPRLEKGLNHQYGFDRPYEECFNNNNPKKNCFIHYTLPSDYEFKHPRVYKLKKADEKIPITYISTKIGENVSFIPHLSKKTNDKYCIIRYEYNDTNENDEGKVTYAAEINTDGTPHLLSYDKLEKDGIFKIFPISSRVSKNKKCTPTENTNYTLAIKVLPYSEDTKKFVYIQLDGGEKNLESNSDFPNAFTKKDVDEHVNKVFKQAVLKAVSTDGNAELEKNGITDQNNLIEINYGNPGETYAKFSSFLKKIYDYYKIASNPPKDSEVWHITMAINKVRKKWPLASCKKEASISLNNCPNFYPEEDFKNAEYYIKSEEKCRDGVKPKDKLHITIRSTPITKDGYPTYYFFKARLQKNYYAFFDNNEKVDFKDCDTLFTDNGYPVIPLKDAITGNTAAASINFNKKLSDKHEVYDHYLHYGSITLVPRGVGDAAYSTFVHELAHSYGLTDVAETPNANIHIISTRKPKIEYDASFSQKNDWSRYDNYYATNETNLMSFSKPNGESIRYRDPQITCTGGGNTFKTKFETKFGTYTFNSFGPKLVTGIGENQWECLRDCFRSEASTLGRKKYWITASDEWEDGKKNWLTPTGEEYKYFEENECLNKEPKVIETTFEEYLNTFQNKVEFFAYEFTPLLLKDYISLNVLKDYYSLEQLITCRYDESNYCFTSKELRNCKNKNSSASCFDTKELDEYLKKYPRI